MKLAMNLAHMQSVSACIIKNNTIKWSGNYGFSNRLLLEKPTINTNYMAGSISKTITAIAIMQLYENESYDFDLDDNVSKWLPFDIKNPTYPDVNITFRMLLSHQSSLHDHDKISELNYLFSDSPISFPAENLTSIDVIIIFPPFCLFYGLSPCSASTRQPSPARYSPVQVLPV